MSKFAPLHCHSHYSLLDGLSKPAQIAERCEKLGYSSCAITDHGNISGAVGFMKALKKKNIKPILGCELYISQKDPTEKNSDNFKLSHLCVLAKNLPGWKNLIKAVSHSNNPDFFYRKPRLSLDRLAPFSADRNMVSFSGHMGSDLANVLFKDYKAAYNSTSYEEAKSYISTTWKEDAIKLAGKYQDIFGKENFFIEIQLIDYKNLPAAEVIVKALRYIAKQCNIPCVATADSHYPSKEDASDQRILLCSAMETTLAQVKSRLDNNEETGLSGFFKSNNYHIPSHEEMLVLHTEEEINNTLKIAEMCESYDILSKNPNLPPFECPNGMNADDYLRQLCVAGWNNLVKQRIPKEKHQIYADRIKMELGVFKEANLASYFLIVQDYCNFARSNGWLMSPGRGSGAGSLVSALIGITDKIVDPIEYGLLFERFYNAGRNVPGRISLPDIDCDFPISHREEQMDYIRKKYGEAKVSQMVTFSRMQGRGALKDVLRAHDSVSFDEMNRITEFIPDEAEIADELQLMREETGEASIIKWALDNNPDQLKQWCFVNEDGTFDGPLSKLFEQAIRLEGTKRSQGKHAAGVIISSQPLAEVCPMVYDKSSNLMIAGMEMGDLEAMGHVKFDILGVAVLDKIMGVQELVEYGTIEGE